MTNVSKKWFATHIAKDNKILSFKSTDEVWEYREDQSFPESYDADQQLICFDLFDIP